MSELIVMAIFMVWAIAIGLFAAHSTRRISGMGRRSLLAIKCSHVIQMDRLECELDHRINPVRAAR